MLTAIRSSFQKKNRRRWLLTLLALPFVIHIIAIRYVPLAGWALAFFNYKPGRDLATMPFVGLKYFKLIGFYREDVLNALTNTVALSTLALLFSWFPMLLAILINEIRSRRRRMLIQTAITIPNFVSWVIVYSLCFCIFSSEGLFNQVFHTTNNVLGDKKNIWFFMEGLTIWKTAGWQCTLHVTLPGIMSTFIVLLLLQVGSFLSVGMDQYFAFSNVMVQSKLEVLELYTYRIGLKTMDYSFATAISIIQSLVSVALLLGVNGLSKLTRGEGII